MSEENTNTNPDTENANPNLNVGLSLNDLAAVVRLIDVCSKRGAFEGVELTSVGELRNKFSSFVEANKPPEENTENTESETQSQ